MKPARGKAAATKEGSGGEALKRESGIWRVVPRLPRINVRALFFSFFLFKKKLDVQPIKDEIEINR